MPRNTTLCFRARRSHMRSASVRWAPVVGLTAALALGWLVLSLMTGGTAASGRQAPLPVPHPLVSDYMQLTHSETPPTQAQCNSAGRRCFNPQSTRAAYDVGPLYAQGIDGSGQTIAIVDSYGSDTMAHDLHVYDQTWGLPRSEER